MDLKLITDIARKEMKPRKSLATRERGYLWHHGIRVAHIAMELCDLVDPEERVNRETVYAGALFHDVGKGTKPHNEAGAKIAMTLLQGACAPWEVEETCRLIRLHNRRSEATDMAAWVVQDADAIDHVGAQQVWLSFLWNAQNNQSQEESLEYYFGEENRGWQAGIRERLNFDAAKAAFDHRLGIADRFFEEMRRENEGHLCLEAIEMATRPGRGKSSARVIEIAGQPNRPPAGSGGAKAAAPRDATRRKDAAAGAGETPFAGGKIINAKHQFRAIR